MGADPVVTVEIEPEEDHEIPGDDQPLEIGPQALVPERRIEGLPIQPHGPLPDGNYLWGELYVLYDFLNAHGLILQYRNFVRDTYKALNREHPHDTAYDQTRKDYAYARDHYLYTLLPYLGVEQEDVLSKWWREETGDVKLIRHTPVVILPTPEEHAEIVKERDRLKELCYVQDNQIRRDRNVIHDLENEIEAARHEIGSERSDKERYERDYYELDRLNEDRVVELAKYRKMFGLKPDRLYIREEVPEPRTGETPTEFMNRVHGGMN